MVFRKPFLFFAIINNYAKSYICIYVLSYKHINML